MTRIRHIRRLAVAPASLAGALLAFAAAAPAALARPGPPRAWQLTDQPLPICRPAGTRHPPLPPAHWTGPVQTVVVGGMPGWQIAVIATRAALAAATVAVLLDRGWAARCRSPLSEA